MREHTVNESSPSTRVWAGWEELFRRQVQSVLQALLEEEVTEFLGRVKSQRRDPAGGRGNGTGRLPEWAWPAAPVERRDGDAHRASPASARPGGAVREPGAAPLPPPHRRR